jgi:hypothetical protein
MTSRLITILAVALAVAALVGASIRLTGSSPPAARPVHTWESSSQGRPRPGTR